MKTFLLIIASFLLFLVVFGALLYDLVVPPLLDLLGKDKS